MLELHLWERRPWLGHGGQQHEQVPRLVEALAGKKVVGAAASHDLSGFCQTVVWTETGELFTFGCGSSGVLGHGGDQTERVRIPRLVVALAGKKVVGATGSLHAAAWTDEGGLFTFGWRLWDAGTRSDTE